MWPLLIGAALGLGKTGFDSVQQKKEIKAQAGTTRWSPWTGMKAADPRKLDPLGDIMKGGLTGAMAGNMMAGGGAATTGTTVTQAAPTYASPWDKVSLMADDPYGLNVIPGTY